MENKDVLGLDKPDGQLTKVKVNRSVWIIFSALLVIIFLILFVATRT